MDLAILRLIHIGAGVFWVGAFYTFFLFVQPTAMSVGPAGQQFMYGLLHHRRFSVILLAAAITTVLAGIWLLWLTTDGLRLELLFDNSRLGFTIGGTAAILTLGVGVSYVFPRTRIIERVLGGFIGEGRPPSDDERAQLMTVGSEARAAGRWVVAGLAIAVLCMATARYWGVFL
jgi:uncharacterized membrane protein